MITCTVTTCNLETESSLDCVSGISVFLFFMSFFSESHILFSQLRILIWGPWDMAPLIHCFHGSGLTLRTQSMADLKSLAFKKKVLSSALLSMCVVASIQGFDHVSPLWQNMTGIWRQALQENADQHSASPTESSLSLRSKQ